MTTSPLVLHLAPPLAAALDKAASLRRLSPQAWIVKLLSGALAVPFTPAAPITRDTDDMPPHKRAVRIREQAKALSRIGRVTHSETSQ